MGIGIVIDLILIAIVVLNVVIGYKKGLINVIFNIFAFFIAIILTLILYKPVSAIIINNTDFKDNIKQIIIDNNDKNNEIDEKDIKSKDETYLQKYVNNKIVELEKTGIDKAKEVIADTISQKVIEILVGLILFIIIRILLVLLKFITEGIAELPIIKQFNHIGGIAYGIIKSIIIIYLLLLILFIVMSLKADGLISNMVNSSVITKYLMELNIL